MKIFYTIVLLLLTSVGLAQSSQPEYVFEKDGYSYTKIGKACFDGDYTKVEKLLKQGLILWKRSPREHYGLI